MIFFLTVKFAHFKEHPAQIFIYTDIYGTWIVHAYEVRMRERERDNECTI